MWKTKLPLALAVLVVVISAALATSPAHVSQTDTRVKVWLPSTNTYVRFGDKAFFDAAYYSSDRANFVGFGLGSPYNPVQSFGVGIVGGDATVAAVASGYINFTLSCSATCLLRYYYQMPAGDSNPYPQGVGVKTESLGYVFAPGYTASTSEFLTCLMPCVYINTANSTMVARVPGGTSYVFFLYDKGNAALWVSGFPTTIDSGQSATLTPIVLGGSPPYAYSWYEGPHCSGSVVGTSAAFKTPPLSATTTYCLAVTDSMGATATATLTVTVNPRLTVAISSVPIAVDGSVAGYSNTRGTPVSVILTTTMTNDVIVVIATSNTYHANWHSDPTISDAAGLAWSKRASTFGGSHEIGIEEWWAFTPHSLSGDLITVIPGPSDAVCVSALGISGANTTSPFDANGALPNFQDYPVATTSPSGQYTTGNAHDILISALASDNYIGANPTGFTQLQSDSAPTAVSYASAYSSVSTTQGGYAPKWTTNAGLATVLSDAIMQAAPTTAQIAMSPGQTAELTAIPSGGSGGYAYEWYSGSGCSGSLLSRSDTYTTPPLVSTVSYCVRVTDSDGNTATDSLTITVNTTPTVTISPSAPTVDSGQSITLTAIPSGGSGGYAYLWYLGTGCSGTVVGTSATLSTGPLFSTTAYCVSVTDSLGQTATATVAVTVNSSLAAGAATPSTPAIDRGQSITLTASPSGGTPPYAYQWYSGTSASCASDTTLLGTALTQALTPSDSTYYCYKVTDSAQPPASAYSATDKVTVNPILTAGAITPSSPKVDSGQTVILTANPSGGTLPYSYQWYTGAACTLAIGGATSATYAASPSSTTTYYYSVVDSAFSIVSKCSPGDTVTVHGALLAGAITPASPKIVIGQSVTLTSRASGGTTPYAYQWYADGTCSTVIQGATAARYAASPTVTTTYSYMVTDSATLHVSACSQGDTVTVGTRATRTSVAPSSASLVRGTAITLTVTVTDTSPGTPGAPVGTVSWSASKVGGTFSSTVCALSAISTTQSQCSVSYTAPSTTGSVTITASYGGDSIHGTSSGRSNLRVT